MATPYYYLASSLPSISFEGKSSISSEKFLDECQRLLAPVDYQTMKKLMDLSSKSDVNSMGKTASMWFEFDRNLRNVMVSYRANALNKDAQEYYRGEVVIDSAMSDIINQAAKAANPLEGERLIDRTRWDFLEKLADGQYYNFDFLITYGLKLQILEKYNQVDSPRGREIFEDLKKVDLSDKF